jgi:hypothetical protein
MRFSRAAIDDSIAQNLNALPSSAREGFDSSSTFLRLVDSVGKRKVAPEACRSFQNNILFPSWQTRSDILDYCAVIATSADPSDPVSSKPKSTEVHEQVIDERLDPYSAHSLPKETRRESLAILIQNERGIEQIVRSRTWNLIAERCNIPEDWVEALNHWREERKPLA